MQTLIFSDTHLLPFFDQKKADFLIKLIQAADRVIINGDFWDGDLWSFEAFVKSPWQQLFPVLKSKETIYIYGNHDKMSKADSRVNLFSDQQDMEIRLTYGKRTFIITHGHQYDLTFHQWFKSPLGKLLVHNKLFLYGLMLGEEILMRCWDKRISQKKLRWINEEIKIQMESKTQPDTWLVCGHTHSAELDLKNQFVNSGFIRAGFGQYLTINDVGFIELHEAHY